MRYCRNDNSHAERAEIAPTGVESYTLTFDLAGGTLNGSTGTLTMVCKAGSVIEMPAPIRDGYDFLYWEGSRYYAGDKYKVEEDHTFKAVWGQKATPKGRAEAPKTGDGASVASLALIALFSLIAIVVLFAVHRRID